MLEKLEFEINDWHTRPAESSNDEMERANMFGELADYLNEVRFSLKNDDEKKYKRVCPNTFSTLDKEISLLNDQLDMLAEKCRKIEQYFIDCCRETEREDDFQRGIG